MKKKILKIVSSILGLFAICGALCCSLFLGDHNKVFKTNADSSIYYNETDTGYIFKKTYSGLDNQNYPDYYYWFESAELVFTYVESTNTISVVLNINSIGMKDSNSERIMTPLTSSSIDFGSFSSSFSIDSFTIHIGQLNYINPGEYKFMTLYISFFGYGSLDKSFTNINLNYPFGSTGDIFRFDDEGRDTFNISELKDVYSSSYEKGFNYAYYISSMPFYSAVYNPEQEVEPNSIVFRDNLPTIAGSTYTGNKIQVSNGFYEVSINNVSTTKSITVTGSAEYIRFNDEVIGVNSNSNSFIYNFNADVYDNTKIYLYFDNLYKITNNQYNIRANLDLHYGFNEVEHYYYDWFFTTGVDFSSSALGNPYLSNYQYRIDYNDTKNTYKIAYNEGYNVGWLYGTSQSQGDYNEGYHNGYTLGFNEAESFYTATQSVVYDNGYRAGYNEGYDVGKREVEFSLTSDISNAYTEGYNDGYDEAYRADSTVSTIFSNILLIGMLPVDFFLKILNWEFLGINIASFVSALLSVAATVIVIRIVTGKRND